MVMKETANVPFEYTYLENMVTTDAPTNPHTESDHLCYLLWVGSQRLSSWINAALRSVRHAASSHNQNVIIMCIVYVSGEICFTQHFYLQCFQLVHKLHTHQWFICLLRRTQEIRTDASEGAGQSFSRASLWWQSLLSNTHFAIAEVLCQVRLCSLNTALCVNLLFLFKLWLLLYLLRAI